MLALYIVHWQVKLARSTQQVAGVLQFPVETLYEDNVARTSELDVVLKTIKEGLVKAGHIPDGNVSPIAVTKVIIDSELNQPEAPSRLIH